MRSARLLAKDALALRMMTATVSESNGVLQTHHPQAVRLIDHGGRIADATFLFCVLLCDLPVGRVKFGKSAWQSSRTCKCLFDVFLVTLSNRCESLLPPAARAAWRDP